MVFTAETERTSRTVRVKDQLQQLQESVCVCVFSLLRDANGCTSLVKTVYLPVISASTGVVK